MGYNGSLPGRIVTWLMVGVLAIVALKIAVRLIAFLMGLLGVVFGIAMFLLFTVGPVLLIGWLAVKAWQAFVREEPAI